MKRIEMEKSLEKIEETLNAYRNVNYLSIFKKSFNEAFFSKFGGICSVIMMTSTLIQRYYVGTALWIALITSSPIILTPVIWGITQCLSARSFLKFDTAILQEDKRILEENLKNVV